ncbi:hypothetical protein ACQPXM_33025 [Kribbella sp. CA-253562]|uniref:hypothetical protein n=1 Tax=Kribbella sp. CA-253562 TaxID=3239942 RepID=UPI003D8C741B
MSKLRRVLEALLEPDEPGPPASEDFSDARIKHLEFIQGAILRMAGNSFLFKGWAISLASGLAAFAAIESRRAVLFVGIVSTLLFWAMDGYYLWLERGFVGLHVRVAKLPASQPVDYAMAVDKTHALRRWLRTMMRWHLLLLYGTIVVVNIVGALYLKEVKNG